MADIVRPDSLVTLHYRIALSDDTELISTFDTTPATLQLGCGELASTLERCLDDLPVGERRIFLLEPDQAFGKHNPSWVDWVERSALPADAEVDVLAVVEFAGPDGARHTGLIRELTEKSALIDFNHPLAGKSIRFEVEVVGVL